MQKKTSSGPRPIQDVLRSVLRESGAGKKPQTERVFEAWRVAVGPALATRTSPVRFRGGELLVEVESAPHLQELKSFTGEDYRLRTNAELGSETVRRIAFKLKG